MTIFLTIVGDLDDFGCVIVRYNIIYISTFTVIVFVFKKTPHS